MNDRTAANVPSSCHRSGSESPASGAMSVGRDTPCEDRPRRRRRAGPPRVAPERGRVDVGASVSLPPEPRQRIGQNVIVPTEAFSVTSKCWLTKSHRMVTQSVTSVNGSKCRRTWLKIHQTASTSRSLAELFSFNRDQPQEHLLPFVFLSDHDSCSPRAFC